MTGDKSHASQRALSYDLRVICDRAVRPFIRDGTLVAVPAKRSKRLVVLDMLAQEFEPGVYYAEVEVNRRLRKWHSDVAALRRYLVEEGFLGREGGCGDYWRIGGRFDCD